jgi:hypothetical protein
VTRKEGEGRQEGKNESISRKEGRERSKEGRKEGEIRKEGRKDGRMEGRKKGRKEERKEGRKEGRQKGIRKRGSKEVWMLRTGGRHSPGQYHVLLWVFPLRCPPPSVDSQKGDASLADTTDRYGKSGFSRPDQYT